MMSLLLMMMFMIPLSFLKKSFWLNQLMYFMMTFFFLLKMSYNYMFLSVYNFWGWDLLSYMMILLSIWICSLMILASYKLEKTNFFSNLFLLVMLFLLMSLYLAFSSMNLFVFYLFFEMSLIPTLILIMGWGYQPERIQAGVYLLFYTLFASLPMMISVFWIYSKFMSLDFYFLSVDIPSILLYMCVNMVFLIKMPMFFFHLWLPKAHVEAPVSGSMILAGIMLKLGGYGMLRMMKLFSSVGLSINYFFISISIVGGVFVSLICLRQMDIKALIAYSSVAHMGLVLSGILTFSYWGFSGSLVMMIAHGLCSSGLFCLANISYERLNSRSLMLNKGLMNLLPSMSLWWFLLSSSNMAAPPSLNLLGEIMLINSLVSWSSWTMSGLIFVSFFSAAYSLYLFSYTQHGKFYSGMYCFSLGSLREFLLLFLHWFPLNILIMKSELFCLFI
uniref:NADH-ubiquinone oxidoreductase chain 4 n=1 Tax=Coomaniella dentata TaxID=2936731 RepID=A0A8T9VYJ3_9COLE|nr:NADH dehydrogenase subunit 4 [Coomaniella dentata]UPI13505.1 NADH dehydrogenase subunit 4 [Coomaniella dentata]